MNNDDTESSTSETNQNKIERNSKIDIRRLCSKFENLSSSNHQNSPPNSNSTDKNDNKIVFTPIPPARKHRKFSSEVSKTEFETDKIVLRKSGSLDHTVELSEKAAPRLSVLEKTKLFENISTSPTKPKFEKSFTDPPDKPPRRENCPSQSSTVSSSCDKKFLNSVPPMRNASCYPLQDDSKTSKNDNLTTKVSKTPKSNTKAFVKNYFKNLSVAANHLREKVANRQANHVFVDLTPTTVTPPKEYGTLKRCFSEEHIYAEPYEPKTSLMPEEKALHYMSTDVVNDNDSMNKTSKLNFSPNSQSELKKRRKLTRSSVRNAIYESFSSLRQINPNDNTKSDGTNVKGDSESDVSVKDIQERIIYVKSVKKQTSASSICIAPKLFELVLLINISETGPEIILKYPKIPKSGYDFPLIPQLCFPDYTCLDKAAVYKSERFYFTLPNNNEEKIIGYCHRILGWPEQTMGYCTKFPVAICLLSNVYAPLFYNKILTEIEKHIVLPAKACFDYLANLQKLGVPNSGASLSVPDYSANTTSEPLDRVVITRSLDSQSFGINLTRVLQLLDIDVLLRALASLLLERRVLLLSNNSSNLLHSCAALSSLLYPFQWQHILIPILPNCLLVQSSVETPYLLGALSSNQTAILELLGEQKLLIIDVDKGFIVKSCNDEDTILPRKVQKAVVLALNLAKNMTDPTEMMRDVMIAEAVMHLFVEILGHCENHFVPQNDTFCFQKEIFQKSANSRSIQQFLEWFSETQMFEDFIEEFKWRTKYREICQSQQKTVFEKRIEEYKWEVAHANDKITKKIGKTVRTIGEKLKNLTKN